MLQSRTEVRSNCCSTREDPMTVAPELPPAPAARRRVGARVAVPPARAGRLHPFGIAARSSASRLAPPPGRVLPQWDQGAGRPGPASPAVPGEVDPVPAGPVEDRVRA